MAKSILVHHSLAYDFLISIFRMNTNELMFRRLGRLRAFTEMKPSGDLID